MFYVRNSRNSKSSYLMMCGLAVFKAVLVAQQGGHPCLAGCLGGKEGHLFRPSEALVFTTANSKLHGNCETYDSVIELTVYIKYNSLPYVLKGVIKLQAGHFN